VEHRVGSSKEQLKPPMSRLLYGMLYPTDESLKYGSDLLAPRARGAYHADVIPPPQEVVSMVHYNIDDYDKPKNRDTRGHFLAGNQIGSPTRWQPGTSGNPGGSRSAGAWIGEWMNVLCGEPSHALLAVIKNDDEPVAKQIAARRLLGGRSEGRDGREETALVCDRTAGRPTQSVQLQEDRSSHYLAMEALQKNLGVLSPEHRAVLAEMSYDPDADDEDDSGGP
jgi:hypothetical protein